MTCSIKGVACFQVYISADLNFHLIPLKKKKNETKKDWITNIFLDIISETHL